MKYFISLFAPILLLLLCSSVQLQTEPWSQPIYNFTLENVWFTMKDGVRLAATLGMPIPLNENEIFPVTLEYLPYRKDDSFYAANFIDIWYFSRRGYISAKVDIRGTGGSEGIRVPKEYSDIELDDGEEIIRQLAIYPRSNGAVGMLGLGWSGFNSLMMATMRKPPALKAIYAAHASEDLYYNDVHYIDGVLHEDEYILSIDHENALPSSPLYSVDNDYISNRFLQYPWMDLYLQYQNDNVEFWHEHSIMYHYENLTIPCYLVSGLYDSYRDAAFNIYTNVKAHNQKVKLVAAPVTHTMPEDQTPGPGYDSNSDIVSWFDYWLKEKNTGVMEQPDLTIYVRNTTLSPTESMNKPIPGEYRYETTWPIERIQLKKMYLIMGKMLSSQQPASNSSMPDELEYMPWIGVQSRTGWGGLTGDQSELDKYALVYDSEILNKTIEIVGFVNVTLEVSTNVTQTNWIVRLEDVHPNGEVTLVTGSLRNGAQINGRLLPRYLTPNQMYTITLSLHFTTWTFQLKHRLRVSILNSYFPALWPSPFPMKTKLYFGTIDLPVIPSNNMDFYVTPDFTQRQRVPSDLPIISDRTLLLEGNKTYMTIENTEEMTTTVSYTSYVYQSIKDFYVASQLRWNLTVHHYDASNVTWTAMAKQIYVWNIYPNITMCSSTESGLSSSCLQINVLSGYPTLDLTTRRSLELQTSLSINSDQNNFYTNTKRTLMQNGTQTLVNQFKQTHPRQFQ